MLFSAYYFFRRLCQLLMLNTAIARDMLLMRALRIVYNDDDFRLAMQACLC